MDETINPNSGQGNPTETTAGSNVQQNDLNNQTAQTDITPSDSTIVDLGADGGEGGEGNDGGEDSIYESDENPYKKRYSDSSKEAQRLANENKQMLPYAQLGAGFYQRMQTDPRFKQAIEGLSASEQKQVEKAMDKQETVNQERAEQGLAPQAVKLDPELQAKIDKSYEVAVQQEAKQKAEVTETVGKMWMEVEGNQSTELDKFTKVATDSNGMPIMNPNGGLQYFNPVRYAIGQAAEALQKNGMSQQEAAKTAFNTVGKALIAQMSGKSNVDPETARAEGLIDGLESNSISTTSTGKGTQQRTKKVVWDEEQKKVFRQMGFNPDDPKDAEMLARNWNSR